jgi:hypothetical protein
MENSTDTVAVTQADTVAELRVPCLVYSRIVGYLTPTAGWNAGKAQEFIDRRAFEVRGIITGVENGS